MLHQELEDPLRRVVVLPLEVLQHPRPALADQEEAHEDPQVDHLHGGLLDQLHQLVVVRSAARVESINSEVLRMGPSLRRLYAGSYMSLQN